MSRRLVITNGKVITPEEVLEADVWIEDGRILRVGGSPDHWMESEYKLIDAAGMYVAPGMIEIHCDAIEKEMEPRPNTFFPLEMAMNEMERKLAGNGITTIYHSISLSDGSGIRGDEQAVNLMNSIDKRRKNSPSMVRHRIHLRYELTNRGALPVIESFIRNQKIDLLSFMDHSPGQGQFKSMEGFQEFTKKQYNITDEQAVTMTKEVLSLKEKVEWEDLREMAQYAHAEGVSLASHDDDTVEKIDYILNDFPISISEFPITMEAARHASDKGLYVSVGAPNIVRGFSHSGNMRAIEAVLDGAAHIICSDYHPSALLPSVAEVRSHGISLPEAWKMVSLYPAEALGIANERGSLEAGKQADILFIDMEGSYPAVRRTVVEGQTVYHAQRSLIG
ncbi:alpha-D-ribose 1-methylphosphonate 5-triphosphate diphosphatase [Halobacillus halophilus]|uniref:alpha-D-ribose 1-methylphosphonate 5-triphosphate diphosphatase n=1 Tax=Halobacillus halophilus TaxID=1570 RepID=UPI001CD5152D|nr:alpha-D-ribose 1-methylphosphonate 5-triphosphate diphosphatase [Halobacillus halophilus]MCA1011956.1 alpha-D-ribose 1-methylphosphonate 5-triphosphate diphosphatase [Halobacillus halophilus]